MKPVLDFSKKIKIKIKPVLDFYSSKEKIEDPP